MEARLSDLLPFYQSWVPINSVCRDKTSPRQRHHFQSRTIWTRTRSTARGADISHQSVGKKKSWQRQGDVGRWAGRDPPPQSGQEAEAERRKILRFLQGAISHLAAGDEATIQPNVGHTPWLPLRSPQAFIWSQGIWILHVAPKGLLRMDEDNVNIVHQWGCSVKLNRQHRYSCSDQAAYLHLIQLKPYPWPFLW